MPTSRAWTFPVASASSTVGARLVEIDATQEPYLAQAFEFRVAPTVLLADASGRVQACMVGAEGVDAYVRKPK